jgi:N-acetylglutamate synthase-like GNAT family acetyltransferase
VVTEIDGTVRRATTEDLEAILELDRTTPVGRVRGEYLTARVRADEVIVFERNALVVGYLVRRARSFIGRDFVDLMAVAIDLRRQGVGSALLEDAVRSSSTDRIFTSTNRSNSPMRDLLELSGWHFSGELDGIDEGDPEWIFYRDRR